jgi:hypothetical protein
LNKFLIQINPQFTELSLDQLVSQFLNLTQNPNLDENTKKMLPQILGKIYSISFKSYREIAKYLSKNNIEMYKHLNS